ncbi:MAG: ABC transporter permease [Sulfolobales archaeon]
MRNISLTKIFLSYPFIRGLRAIAVILASITFTFFIIRLMPGNPIDVYINTLISTYGLSYQDAKAQALALFSINLDEPLYIQYITYISNLFRGDLGKSIVSVGTPVAKIIADFLPWTVFTVSTALLISFSLGIIIGMFMAYRRGRSYLDSILATLFSILSSVPNFIVGILLIVFLGVQWKLVPFDMLRGSYSPYIKPGFTADFILDVLKHAIFPIITYVITTIGIWALSMRGSTISYLGEDYVFMARARGLPERRVAITYVGRNAILPLFTSLAISIGFIFGGSVLIESVFVYRGIGLRLLEAINSRDYTVMQGIFLIITIAVIAANYIADLLYSILDPRVRTGVR